MEVISLNTNKQKVAVIDSYKSFIWNDRYEDLGDFELYIPANAVETLANIHQDYYIQCSESDRTMIVEKVSYKTDLENGNFVIISGRSLESILQRRILWNDDGSITQINATKIIDPTDESEDSGSSFFVWQAIEYLLKLYVIDPGSYKNNAWRQIPNFVFETPTDPEILFKTMSPCSYQGDNLYDVIKSLCEMYEFSFKVTMDEETKDFVFSLYKGVSHLASQTDNPYVCFSNDFDNLTSSDSSLDMATYKNMAYYRGTGSKYIVKYFSADDIEAEVGYVRIYNNKTYACKTEYDHIPDEYEVNHDPEYTVNKAKVSRTEIGGALIAEIWNGSNTVNFYLTTEPEPLLPGESDDPDDKDSYVLLYSTDYDTKTKYYKCIVTGNKKGWIPSHWKEIAIKASWKSVTPEAYSISKAYKENDFCKYNNVNYVCIEEIAEAKDYDATKTYKEGDYCLHESHKYKCNGDISEPEEWNAEHWTQEDWNSDSWLEVEIKVVGSNWEYAETWNKKKKYAVGVFVTFDDSSRTGKIGIYRKTAKDAVYGAKKTYNKNAVVWYKSYMYVCKKNNTKGHNPTNSKYWKKLTDKYKIFDAQQWEAVDDIEEEAYEVYGSVQDKMVSGLNRRELFVDATSVPSSYDYYYNDKQEETVNFIVNEGVFQSTLKDMALAELTTPSNRMTKALEAEIEYDTNFKYRRDYNIGDVVEVRDIYGYYDSVRVKEFIISDDDSGTKCYPTFESVEASTITTRYLEVNDELKDNTILVKIPESTRFNSEETIAVSINGDDTYYLKSFVKRVTVDSEYEEGKKIKRDMHIVAWVTTDDVYTEYEEQKADEILKSHPTMVGEPLFYIDVDAENNIQLPGILFPSWSPPNGVDLGVISEVDVDTSQYYNILLANI